MKKDSLKSIAEKINEYLKKFENDPSINQPKIKTKLVPFFHANATHSGRWVYVCYVSFQGQSNLSREEAIKYLSWLEAGGVGTHYTMKNNEEKQQA